MSAQVEWYRAVHKHEHQGAASGEYCARPWSGLCQSEWGVVGVEWGSRVCWHGSYKTHGEAMAGLEAHVREGACDPERDWNLHPGDPACRGEGAS